VLRENGEHLDPDGCLVQQRNTEPTEDAAKAAGGMRPIRQNSVWRVGAALLRKKLQRGVRPLDKGLFMGANGKKALFAERN
jgi:hypothetical protein